MFRNKISNRICSVVPRDAILHSTPNYNFRVSFTLVHKYYYRYCTYTEDYIRLNLLKLAIVTTNNFDPPLF